MGSLVVLLLVYFFPGIIAMLRKRPNAGAILMLNLLFGWTIIGWGFALVWAVMSTPPTVIQVRTDAPD